MLRGGNWIDSYITKAKELAQKARELLLEAKKKPTNQTLSEMPPRSTMQKIAEASYDPQPQANIDLFQLMHSTPTLKFYRHGSTIVVGIRGTLPTDVEDLKADALIPISLLETSPRYKNDLATLQQFQQQYPMTQYAYYGAAHSLGGAILDGFLKANRIKSGISYNPAVQPMDYKTVLANHRIYNESDPLYKFMGRHTVNPEVRPASPLHSLLQAIPWAGQALSAYSSHQLSNFKGGTRQCGMQRTAGCRSPSL